MYFLYSSKHAGGTGILSKMRDTTRPWLACYCLHSLWLSASANTRWPKESFLYMCAGKDSTACVLLFLLMLLKRWRLLISLQWWRVAWCGHVRNLFLSRYCVIPASFIFFSSQYTIFPFLLVGAVRHGMKWWPNTSPQRTDICTVMKQGVGVMVNQ